MLPMSSRYGCIFVIVLLLFRAAPTTYSLLTCSTFHWTHHNGRVCVNPLNSGSTVNLKQYLNLSSGHPHTVESKAKISAANKGKTPWNVGKRHSEETRQKIIEKTREAIINRKRNLAESMGLTLEEYEEHKKQVRRQRNRKTTSQGLTEDGRKRISESMKRRWADPEYRHNISSLRNHTHTETTRQKISEAIKKKWQDSDYRSKVTDAALSIAPEVRDKISSTLKARWKNPDFRAYMTNSLSQRDPDWALKISEKIKNKWQDPNYRYAVVSGLSKTNKSQDMIPSQRMNDRSNSSKINEKLKYNLINDVRSAVVSGRVNKSLIKSMLGTSIWTEEKLKRKREGDAVLMDDETLANTLLEEWTLQPDIRKTSKNSRFSGMPEDLDTEEDADVIEVYDENGDLVGSYSASEYSRLKHGQ